MFRPLRGVQNHITLTIDSANLRWLLAACDDLPSSRRMMGFSPRRCSFIPHRNTAACWMLMLNSLCFPSEFFFQASGTSGSARVLFPSGYRSPKLPGTPIVPTLLYADRARPGRRKLLIHWATLRLFNHPP